MLEAPDGEVEGSLLGMALDCTEGPSLGIDEGGMLGADDGSLDGLELGSPVGSKLMVGGAGIGKKEKEKM